MNTPVISLADRAISVGLPENATEKEIIIMESTKLPGGPSTLAARAIAAGIDYNSTEGQVSAAEVRNKANVYNK